MASPTHTRSAREHLIQSIVTWADRLEGEDLAHAVATDLFGDATPEIRRPRFMAVGPVAQLAGWFASYCEDQGIQRPDETMPAGIMIDPRLLIPLLSYVPIGFDDLHHEFELLQMFNIVACATCELGIQQHYEALERLQMAKIEALESDIEMYEGVMESQTVAIGRQDSAIDELSQAIGKLDKKVEELDERTRKDE